MDNFDEIEITKANIKYQTQKIEDHKEELTSRYKRLGVLLDILESLTGNVGHVVTAPAFYSKVPFTGEDYNNNSN